MCEVCRNMWPGQLPYGTSRARLFGTETPFDDTWGTALIISLAPIFILELLKLYHPFHLSFQALTRNNFNIRNGNLLQNHMVAQPIEEKKKKGKEKISLWKQLSDTQVVRASCHLHTNPNLAKRQDEVEIRGINYSDI